MEFWRLVGQSRQQPKKGLVARVMRDLESGQFVMPKGADVLTRYQTENLSLQPPKPLKVSMPEKRLVGSFLRRYPEAKMEPVALGSFQPSLARSFALRQQQLMRSEGLSKEAAFARLEAEVKPQLARLAGRGSTVGSLGLVQKEELEQLDAGMQQLTEQQRGPG